MNHDITMRQWRNFRHHNAKFCKPTPRTAREAFGCEFEGEDRHSDALVLVVAVAGFLIGLGVVWLS